MHGNGIKIALAFVVDKDLWQCEREWAKNFLGLIVESRGHVTKSKVIFLHLLKGKFNYYEFRPPAPLFALVHFR